MWLNNYQLFVRNKLNLILVLSSLGLNLLLWGFFLVMVKPVWGLVPLHYSIYTGVDLLGPWYELFYIPSFGLAAFILNFILAYCLIDKYPFLGVFILGGTVVSEILLWIPAIYIIHFNGF